MNEYLNRQWVPLHITVSVTVFQDFSNYCKLLFYYISTIVCSIYALLRSVDKIRDTGEFKLSQEKDILKKNQNMRCCY